MDIFRYVLTVLILTVTGCGGGADAPAGQSPATDPVFTIPVVFHLIQNVNDETVVSDDKFLSQIQVLNLAYRGILARDDELPDVVRDSAVDMEISFRLATMDPDGEPTSGITRTVSSPSRDNGWDFIYYSNAGGHDAWPTDQYLNVWVMDLRNRDGDTPFAGSAQRPGGDPLTDGVLVSLSAIGLTPPLSDGVHLGRTLAHETGHWLNLDHECEEPETQDACHNIMSRQRDEKLVIFTEQQKQQVYDQFRPGQGRAELYNHLTN